MYKHEHHKRIAGLLDRLDAGFLNDAGCFFGGGTAIVLLLDEYRESVDIDFIVSSREGYAAIREAVARDGLAGLMPSPVPLHGTIRTDRDKIQMWLNPDQKRPVKLEIVYEARIDVAGEASPWGIPMLSRVDMYAEKLLANADRWNDKSSGNRDALDLAMMLEHWGPVPAKAWQKAEAVYGSSVYDAFGKAVMRLGDNGYLQECLDAMQFAADGHVLLARLNGQLRLSADKLPDWSTVADYLQTQTQQALDRVSAPLALDPSPALQQFLIDAAYRYTVQATNLNSGRYQGEILWTDGLHAVQSVGRDTLVVHASRDWHPAPTTGKVMDVQYQHGLSHAHEHRSHRPRTLSR
ncbi:nucleotidyl transferase AbiEii/AbiGii toxin family protein [Aquitalea palustris]|uniref:nucleotidyl transferase AbiEii/AbiGii toxin family protein n=1 Tax=Aquitalea palustris TaxID=2480983 RepID=UPI001CF001FD|nr:nucleotidyl transferase AbiEii/AbiGii toxin family protein [Aquitalea palustris]